MKRKNIIITGIILLVIIFLIIIICKVANRGTKKINISSESLSETSIDTSVVNLEQKEEGTITDTSITKSGDTSDVTESDKTGLNSAVRAEMLSSLNISDTEITTDGLGASGVVATGKSAEIDVSNTNITTSQNRSKGLMVSNSGKIYANNVNITTVGYKSSAVATDYGGGIIQVKNSTIETNGEDSAGVYSTGNITVENTSITSKAGEGAVIDGFGSITLYNTEITAGGRRGVMIYYTGPSIGSTQITGRFNMTGGSLAALAGPAFYVMNTTAEIELQNVTISSDTGVFLKASVDEYGELGQEGENVTSKGGNAKVTAREQEINGDIVVDSKSTVELNLEMESTFTGAINKENTGKEIKVTLDSTSVWNLTGNCYITSLNAEDGAVINTNGYKITYIDPVNEENDSNANRNAPFID